jgi:hypothetical protein
MPLRVKSYNVTAIGGRGLILQVIALFRTTFLVCFVGDGIMFGFVLALNLIEKYILEYAHTFF